MKNYAIELLLGLLFSVSILAAVYATTAAENAFVYQGY